MAEKSLLLNNEIYLYGDVGDPYGWGDGFTPNQVAEALAEHGPSDVTVRVNSGGGIAFDGMAIYSLFKAHTGKVAIVVDGVAASAASLIAMAGATREMRHGAMLMIHDPASVAIGPASALRTAAATLDKLAENYAAVYAQGSGLDRKQVRDMMLATTWMTADEAIANNFATAKITDAATAMAAFDYRLYAHAPDGLPVRARGDAPQVRPAPEAPAVSPINAAVARMRMRLASI